MQNIYNIRQEWEDLFQRYMQGAAVDREINVAIGPNNPGSTDVTNLRYLFPLAAWLRDNGRISKAAPLSVKIHVQAEDITGDRERIRRFLANLGNLPDIIFFLNQTPLYRADWSPSRIFPLCQVSDTARPAELSADYRQLRHSVCWSGGDAASVSPELAPILGSADALLRYIDDISSYAGAREAPIKLADKERLRRELLAKIEPFRHEMDILSQIIWLFLLRELLESKQLYSIPKDRDTPHIYEEIFAKSRMDAVSYGEALYQLIENACLHSAGHRAWFGFRMYKAGRDVPMSELLKEAETRKRLYDKYHPCFATDGENRNPYAAKTGNIFSGKSRYFFEFFVLDSAWDRIGMVDNYNNRKIERVYGELEKKEEKKKDEPPEEREARLRLAAFQILEDRGELLHTVGQLIRSNPWGDNIDEHIENVTVHYGLRLLQRIINVNSGYLINCTPSQRGDGLYYYNGKDEKGPAGPMTEWTALLPISYHWQPMRDNLPKKYETVNCFERQIPPPRRTVHYLNCGKLLQPLDREPNKTGAIRTLERQLYERLPWRQERELSSSILLLHIDSPQLYQLELFAKALFACISRTAASGRQEKGGPAAVRIAVLLPTVDTLHELLRLFSAFYSGGRQEDMENVQIAFCARNGAGGPFRVNFILAGSGLSNAFEAAKLFAYHHSEDTLENLSLLDYLTNQATWADAGQIGDVPPLFPFDLFLPSRLPEGDYVRLPLQPWKDSWFLQHIVSRLNRDIRAPGNGCMIDNIHARLGSKLHLGRFFEGELLFHDTGNVLRFAYLLAQELLYGEDALEARRHVILLGYEKYSVSLMLHLEDWLKQSDRFSAVHTAIIHDDDEKDGGVEVRPCYDENACSPDSSIQVVAVMPVGTTLSTVYKMYHAAQRDLQLLAREEVPQDQTKNFCLILVNGDLCRENNISEVTKRYWSTVEWENQLVTTCMEVYGGEAKKIRYLIPADAKWLAPDNCSICRRNGAETSAIIDAKNSNTMLSSIFTLWDRRKGRFKDLLPITPEENQKRLSSLLGHILYSHIYYWNNHFQFYLEFSKMYYSHQQEIDNVVAGWTVPMDAFHLVVSPLQFTNSPFLKSVLDRVFHGSARFLHIDLKDSYREEIRMKFIYIAEEFKRMRRVSPGTRFCVHFVDTSIVTGSRLSRAQLMVRMLLQQVDCMDENVELFSKVFLLVNRCSYATVQSFVRDPHRDLYAYLYLAIPSYNTENDFCPACRLVKRYELLEKRSATERLSSEFRRLGKKHEKRRVQDYEQWLKKEILRSPSYFSWLRRWLYVNVPENVDRIAGRIGPNPKEEEADYKAARFVAEQIDRYIREQIDDRPGEKEGAEKNSRQGVLDALAEVSLEKVVSYIKDQGPAEEKETNRECARRFKEAARKIVSTYLIDTRNYMRLYSMQMAYQALEAVDDKLSPDEYRDKLDGLTRKAMLALMASIPELLKKVENPSGLSLQQEERVRFMCRLEWLISYIKVLSREQISKYYHCRRAIMGIMNDMLRLLFVRNEGPDPAKNEQKRDRMIAALEKEDPNWGVIIHILNDLEGSGENFDVQMRALMEYQLTMTLLHRTADLQMSFVSHPDSIASFLRRYYQLADRCFPNKEGPFLAPQFALPSYDKVIRRYLRSLKAAVMTSEDDTPCLALIKTPESLTHTADQKGPCQLNGEQAQVWKLFARYIYLENSRMLYSGMRDLENKLPEESLKQADGKRPADRFGSRMRKLGKAVDDCLRSCYQNLDEEARKEDILYQNILGNFCRFWHDTSLWPPVRPKGGKKSAPPNTIAYLLQYFRLVNSLFKEKRRSFELGKRPYQYEELCHILCGLTRCSMCYIAFRGIGAAPEIFTQSGFHVETMQKGNILTSAKLDHLLHQMDIIRKSTQRRLRGESLSETEAEDIRGEMLIPGVTRLWTKSQEYLIIVVGLKESPLKDEKFCIVLQQDRSTKDRRSLGEQWLEAEALENARNILFMRRRLQAILSRDYTVLLNFRFDYSYVRSVSGKSGHRPRIIHISDLHIKEDLTLGKPSKADRIIEQLSRNLEIDGKQMSVDLLAVTGDIVDGRESNAPQMEENYRYAESLLTRIAIHLWQDKDGYLPHDWRKRVMLTTGNHDYAAMNQFKAIVKRRVLTSGLPVETESGTMSKFAYYIDFLIRYLDPPVNDLIANDLNEIRYYRKLNIKVLILNCSGTAVPRRTNKMGVNSEIVKNLIERRGWVDGKDPANTFRLCLAHYSPSYELSYFLDDYDVLPGWNWSPIDSDTCDINQLVKLFCCSVEHLIHTRYSVPAGDDAGKEPRINPDDDPHRKFLDKFCSLEQALDALQNEKKPADGTADQFYSRLKDLADKRTSDGASDSDKLAAARQVVSDMHKNELYQRIKSYYDWLNQDRRCLNQEQISQLLYEIQENLSMSRYDMGCFKRLMEEVKGRDLTLAGHIHAYAEDSPNHILVADKLFYDGSDDIQGYIITLKEEGADPSYSFTRFT